MPPAREFTFKPNVLAKERLERVLDITPQRILTNTTRQNRIWGEWSPGFIRLHLGSDTLRTSSLTMINRLVIETLLHEYRHAWQYATWDRVKWNEDKKQPYHLRESERDANQWSAANVVHWLDLGRVMPKNTVSNLRHLNERVAARRAS